MNNLYLNRRAYQRRRNDRRRRQLRRRRNIALLLLIALTALLIFGIIKCSRGTQYPKGAICIDPGHGGDYTGAVYEGRQEKDDTLRISLEIQKILEKRGQKVLMTRDSDSNIGLKERTDLANQYESIVFVSIHRNSGAGKGVEIWVEHTAPEPDTQLAKAILANLNDVGIQADRGVKFGYRENNSDADYSVNRESEMPSCLVELGFMENELDNQMFDEHLKEYSEAIADGIIDTFHLEE